MYTVRIKHHVYGSVGYWFTTEPTLDEAKTACERNADHLFGEGEVMDSTGRVVAISNCGATCESPRALVRRPKAH